MLHYISDLLLLQERHLSHLNKIAGFYPVEIGAARQILCVELHLMAAGGQGTLQQHLQFAAQQIVNRKAGRNLFRQFENDGCSGVKWIGIVGGEAVASRRIADHLEYIAISAGR